MSSELQDIIGSQSAAEVQQKVQKLIQQIESQTVEIEHAIDSNLQVLNLNCQPLRELRIAVNHAASEVEAQSGELESLEDKISAQYSSFAEAQRNAISFISKKIEAKKYYIFQDFAQLSRDKSQFELSQLIIDCGDQFVHCADAALVQRNKDVLYDIIYKYSRDTQFLLQIGVQKAAADELYLLSAALEVTPDHSVRQRLKALREYEPGALKGADLYFLDTANRLNPVSSEFTDIYADIVQIFAIEPSCSASQRIPLTNAAAVLADKIDLLILELDERVQDEYAAAKKCEDTDQEQAKNAIHSALNAILTDKISQFLFQRIEESVHTYASQLVRNMNSEESFAERTTQMYMDIGVSEDEISRFRYYREQIVQDIMELSDQFQSQHVNSAKIRETIGDVFAADVAENLKDCIPDTQTLLLYTNILLSVIFDRKSTSYVTSTLQNILALKSDPEEQVLSLCQFILDMHRKISKLPTISVEDEVSLFLQEEGMTIEDFLLEHRLDVELVYNCISGVTDSSLLSHNNDKSAGNLRFQIYAIFEELIQLLLQKSDLHARRSPEVLAALLLIIIIVSSIHVQRKSPPLIEIIAAFLERCKPEKCEVSEVVNNLNALIK